MTMQDRRTFLGVAAASLLPPLLPTGADAQTPAPRPPAELARHALTGPFEGFEAVLVELNIPPGRVGPGRAHRHPGPVLGYIVEGQMRFAINHEPERVLPVGGTFLADLPPGPGTARQVDGTVVARRKGPPASRGGPPPREEAGDSRSAPATDEEARRGSAQGEGGPKREGRGRPTLARWASRPRRRNTARF